MSWYRPAQPTTGYEAGAMVWSRGHEDWIRMVVVEMEGSEQIQNIVRGKIYSNLRRTELVRIMWEKRRA